MPRQIIIEYDEKEVDRFISIADAIEVRFFRGLMSHPHNHALLCYFCCSLLSHTLSRTHARTHRTYARRHARKLSRNVIFYSQDAYPSVMVDGNPPEVTPR